MNPHKTFLLTWVVATALLVAGCNPGPEEKIRSGEPAPETITENTVSQDYSVQPAPPVYTPSSASSPAQQSIAAVTSAMLAFPAGNAGGLIIRASGVVPEGWGKPALIAIDDEDPSSTIKSYKFVAEATAEPGGIPANPIYVELRVDNLPPRVSTIRIDAATNALSVIIARPSKLAANSQAPAR